MPEPLIVASLRGGMNDTDPPLSLQADQCVSAVNVEWVHSMLGERRRGSIAIDVAGSDLAACDRIVWTHRHLPTTDEADAQLWALGITDGSPDTAVLAYKDTSWHTVTMSDAPTLDGVSEYQVQGQTLHGKLFIAYNSAVDRLHVWDDTSLRRAGLAAPTSAPTATDTGSGTFASTRYYRVREAVLSGSTVLRRSEPSPVLTKAPSGSGTGLVVTKPADMGESATHWELEASLDNANFYRIASTVVGTTTATDSVDAATGYAATGTLSEDSGDYTTIPSVKYLLADEDRLLGLSSFEDEALSARLTWTPVYNDPGVGNDERIPLDPVSYRDLDTFEGGGITGTVGPVNGEVWIGKWSHIYKAIRTGIRTSAYDIVPIAKSRGALPGSMVEGVDQVGSPCIYLLDPKVGPARGGADGVVTRAGKDIFTTWQTVNINAAAVVSRAVFYDTPGQVHWFVATGASDVPNKRIVLHVDHTRLGEEGVRRGWAIWGGPSAAAIAVCMFADNIDDDAARNLSLVPFIGLADGLIWRTDTGDDDNGTDYDASVETKPYAPATILNQFEVGSAALLGAAAAGAVVNVTATRDFGKETTTVTGISLAASGSETQVIRPLDDLSFGELTTVAFTIADGTDTTRWELNQLALKPSRGQAA